MAHDGEASTGKTPDAWQGESMQPAEQNEGHTKGIPVAEGVSGLRGIGVSSGRAQGKVRILHNSTSAS